MNKWQEKYCEEYYSGKKPELKSEKKNLNFLEK